MKRLSSWATALILLAAPISAQAPIRVVGTGDPIPGAEGGFFHEVFKPALAGEWLVAAGYSAERSGIFAWHRGVGYEVADRATQLPGVPAGAYLFFDNPAYYDVDASGRVLFALPWVDLGTGEDGAGVWSWYQGVIESVIVSGQVAAGSDRPFMAGRPYRGDPGRFFIGGVEGTPDAQSGAVFSWSDGVGIQRLRGTAVGQALGDPWTGGGMRPLLAMFGAAAPGPSGLWSMNATGQDLRLELAYDTPYPGAPPGTTIELLGNTPLPLHLVARGQGSTLGGLFRVGGDGLELLWDQAEPDPTTGLPHGGFSSGMVGWGENVAFYLKDPEQTSTPGRRLIVRDWRGRFILAAAEGQPLGESVVSLIELHHGGLDAERLAFSALSPADGAVWLLDFGTATLEVPTTSTLGLVGLGLVLAGWGCGRVRSARG